MPMDPSKKDDEVVDKLLKLNITNPSKKEVAERHVIITKIASMITNDKPINAPKTTEVDHDEKLPTQRKLRRTMHTLPLPQMWLRRSMEKELQILTVSRLGVVYDEKDTVQAASPLQKIQGERS